MKFKVGESSQILILLFCVGIYLLYGALNGCIVIPRGRSTIYVLGFLAWWLFVGYFILFFYFLFLFKGSPKYRAIANENKVEILLVLGVFIAIPFTASLFQASKAII